MDSEKWNFWHDSFKNSMLLCGFVFVWLNSPSNSSIAIIINKIIEELASNCSGPKWQIYYLFTGTTIDYFDALNFSPIEIITSAFEGKYKSFSGFWDYRPGVVCLFS